MTVVKICANGCIIANFKDQTRIFKAQSAFLFFSYTFINIPGAIHKIRFRKDMFLNGCKNYCCFYTLMQVSVSSRTIPPGQTPEHDLKGTKPSPRDNHCVQKPSPRDKTGSQKPHPWDIKLETFTNVSINSDTV